MAYSSGRTGLNVCLTVRLSFPNEPAVKDVTDEWAEAAEAGPRNELRLKDIQDAVDVRLLLFCSGERGERAGCP
jgi:hypothetical protein